MSQVCNLPVANSEWSSSARAHLTVDRLLPPSCERVINILEGRGKVTVILHLLTAGTI